jgi:nucleoid DNA-binding protein
MEKENEFDLKDLCNAVAQMTDQTPDQVREVLNAAFYQIGKAVATQGRAELHDIGVFSAKRYKQRSVVTNGTMQNAPACYKIRFKASPDFVNLLNNEQGADVEPKFRQ